MEQEYKKWNMKKEINKIKKNLEKRYKEEEEIYENPKTANSLLFLLATIMYCFSIMIVTLTVFCIVYLWRHL